jgi:predicted lipid-binding transport protein (Tim44 family)
MAGACILLTMAGCAQNGMGPGMGGAPMTTSAVAPPPPLPSPVPPPPSAPAQGFVYPARGQTAQQQEFDRGQCYSWGVQQSGFDPANPPPPTAPPPMQAAPQGGLLRGAFGGAALGAVGGAIGGDAGKGAAIGAAVGGLFGMMRRAEQVEQDQQQQASYASQQQNVLSQGRANYNRAFGVCMTGRGYSVS